MKEIIELAGPFGTLSQEASYPGKGAKPDCISNLTVGKCTPMQVVKQPEHGKTSITEEEK